MKYAPNWIFGLKIDLNLAEGGNKREQLYESQSLCGVYEIGGLGSSELFADLKINWVMFDDQRLAEGSIGEN